MTTVNCSTLSAARVLAHLYNNSKPRGMGMFQYQATAMTEAEAQKELDNSDSNSMDYVKGRPIKTSFDKFPELYSWGYDRDNGGTGTMVRLVDELKKSCEVYTTVPQEMPTKDELAQTITQSRIAITSYGNGKKLSDFKLGQFDNGKKLSDFKLSQFDKVWFVPSFCTTLKNAGIQYSTDWHMYMGSDGTIAKFTGSMGGVFEVLEDDSVVKKTCGMMG